MFSKVGPTAVGRGLVGVLCALLAVVLVLSTPLRASVQDTGNAVLLATKPGAHPVPMPDRQVNGLTTHAQAHVHGQGASDACHYEIEFVGRANGIGPNRILVAVLGGRALPEDFGDRTARPDLPPPRRG